MLRPVHLAARELVAVVRREVGGSKGVKVPGVSLRVK